MNFTNDITILGAGIAGCACAIALKNENPDRRIYLIDKKPRDQLISSLHKTTVLPVIGETLPAQVVMPLQRLGLWDLFLQMNNIPSSGTLSIWGENQAHANESIFSPYGNSWHIDRKQFNQLVLRRALELGIKLLSGTQLHSIEEISISPEGLPNSHDVLQWCLDIEISDLENLELKGEREKPARIDTRGQKYPVKKQLTSRFLIDATGRCARLSKLLGIKKQRHDNLMGVYRYYAPKAGESAVLKKHPDSGQASGNSTDTTTLIEGVQEGWWYCAALPGGRQVVCKMADADHVQREKIMSGENFDVGLRQTRLLCARCANLEPISDPKVVAAYTQCLDRFSGRGWLAVGDAAFTFDPLSSLGIFKALRMSILAAYAVQDYFLGKDQTLEKYQWLGQSEFEGYLRKRQAYYAQENRFPDYKFWQRRRAA